MENYIGKICPFCQTEITAADQVRICPACGVVHHESCWQQNHGCTTAGCPQQPHWVPVMPSVDVCSNCGTVLGADQDFCPKCGTAKGFVQKNICSKCGRELQEGEAFCSKCGQKTSPPKKSRKKVIIPIAAGIASLFSILLLVILILGLSSPSVEEVALSKSTLSLLVDESTSVSYTITPADAEGGDVTWTSSNTAVAKVDNNGRIWGIGEGTCTITITIDGKSDSLLLTVIDASNFANMFSEYSGKAWFYASPDGSYMTVDTNWLDQDDYYDSAADRAIESINSQLGFSGALYQKMLNTSALDGRQTESNDKYTVSWKYHPDHGLEVTYEQKR